MRRAQEMLPAKRQDNRKAPAAGRAENKDYI